MSWTDIVFFFSIFSIRQLPFLHLKSKCTQKVLFQVRHRLVSSRILNTILIYPDFRLNISRKSNWFTQKKLPWFESMVLLEMDWVESGIYLIHVCFQPKSRIFLDWEKSYFILILFYCFIEIQQPRNWEIFPGSIRFSGLNEFCCLLLESSRQNTPVESRAIRIVKFFFG